FITSSEANPPPVRARRRPSGENAGNAPARRISFRAVSGGAPQSSTLGVGESGVAWWYATESPSREKEGFQWSVAPPVRSVNECDARLIKTICRWPSRRTAAARNGAPGAGGVATAGV